MKFIVAVCLDRSFQARSPCPMPMRSARTADQRFGSCENAKAIAIAVDVAGAEAVPGVGPHVPPKTRHSRVVGPAHLPIGATPSSTAMPQRKSILAPKRTNYWPKRWSLMPVAAAVWNWALLLLLLQYFYFFFFGWFLCEQLPWKWLKPNVANIFIYEYDSTLIAIQDQYARYQYASLRFALALPLPLLCFCFALVLFLLPRTSTR